MLTNCTLRGDQLYSSHSWESVAFLIICNFWHLRAIMFILINKVFMVLLLFQNGDRSYKICKKSYKASILLRHRLLILLIVRETQGLLSISFVICEGVCFQVKAKQSNKYFVCLYMCLTAVAKSLTHFNDFGMNVHVQYAVLRPTGVLIGFSSFPSVWTPG